MRPELTTALLTASICTLIACVIVCNLFSLGYIRPEPRAPKPQREPAPRYQRRFGITAIMLAGVLALAGRASAQVKGSAPQAIHTSDLFALMR